MTHITMEQDVPIPMRDGTILKADIFWPAGEGQHPVLIERTPYDKNVRTAIGFNALDAARAGYIVVFQDTRGSFTSEGEWLPWKYEREDGYDTIAWAASLPRSNGRVGTFGASYTGSTQWSSAIAGAPALKAMAPMVTFSDPEDGLMFRGGAIELGLNAWWTVVTAMAHVGNVVAPEQAMAKMMELFPLFVGLESRFWELPSAAQPFLVETGMPDAGVARAFADRSTTNDSRVAGRYDEISIPTLNVSGWFDVFEQGALDNYVAMRARGVPTRLIVGPWAHMTMAPLVSQGELGEMYYGPLATMPGGQTLAAIHLDWYDHWLKEGPETPAHQSGALIFVMGVNQWRFEEDWPLARAVETPLYLGESATLAWEAPAEPGAESAYEYDPADPAMTRGGNLVMGGAYPAGAFDQRDTESRDDVLVFTTEPLAEDTEITGRVRATIFAATDGPSTDWVVRLCEVDARGISRNIVDGIRRVHTEPNRVDEVEIDLWSTSIVIRAGHRLRVHVTSSNFPRWDRNLNTGEPETEGTTMRVARQRILHDSAHPSRIVLPIIPA